MFDTVFEVEVNYEKTEEELLFGTKSLLKAWNSNVWPDHPSGHSWYIKNHPAQLAGIITQKMSLVRASAKPSLGAGMRFSIFKELLYFGNKFPEKQLEIPILTFGTDVEYWDMNVAAPIAEEYLPVLYRDKVTRERTLIGIGNGIYTRPKNFDVLLEQAAILVVQSK